MAEGDRIAGWPLRWQRQSGRAAAESYLLTPYGWWLRAQVSRDAPPPLPGGYTAGEKVFYTGASVTFESGGETYKYVYGEQGEVMGPGTDDERDTHVAVLYSSDTDSRECALNEVRRLRATPAATPRLRPSHATLPTPSARDSLCRRAPALTA